MKLSIKLLFCLIILPFTSIGQGKSFIKTYTPIEYNAHAQNWSVIQNSEGEIFVGNTIGLLVYDAEKWQYIRLNNSIVRSLGKDKNDRIYYGAQDEFGYLVADAKGNMSSKSLVHLLPDSLKVFGDVWKTYCYKNKVIFQTFDYIFIYENEKISVIEAENYFHLGYQHEDDFYIIDREIGLKRLVNNHALLLQGGDFFANTRIYGWINYKDYALVATREKGILKVSFKPGNNISIEPWKTEVDNSLISGEIYCATRLSNGYIGIGTLLNGFYVLAENGKLVQTINKSNGLKCDNIKSCFEDKQGGLWLALDVGIARVEINGRFTYLNEDDGLEGIVNSVAVKDETIYCGTTKGLYEINDKQLQLFGNLNNDVRDIIAVPHHENISLFMVSEVGTFQINKSRQLIKVNDLNGHEITKSKFHKNILYIGTNTGLCIFNYDENSLNKALNKGIPEIRKIAEENDSVIWIGTQHNGVYRISNPLKENASIAYFDTSKGLPHMSHNLPFMVGGILYFGTHKGIFQYNKAYNKFIAASNFANNLFNEKDQIYQIIEGYHHQVWLFKTNEKKHEFILYDYKTHLANFPLRRMSEFDAYQSIFPENELITWFGGPDGLFRFDSAKKSPDSLSFTSKIRTVYGNNDTLFAGYWGFNTNGEKLTKQPESTIPELKYKNNNINFEFAALSFDNEKENMYSHYLEGFDDNWSEWTFESKKSYTNLNEGTYTFHIKSKNVYGKEGEEDTYTFTILPPWYRTGWAYFSYAIGAIVLVYLITQISVRRLKRAKEKLEAIVINRTAEVVAEKEEVEKQKKIVEIKNKDITDSINYAQKIQQAILPLPADFSKVFPQAFIFFQPRDIVSGDFYWFYQPKKIERNWVYIAAADCTGHGVPGAFMSMIGNTLLNEILNEKQIYETDLILNQLHIEVRAALKQDIAQNTTNDGMDIALCRVDLDTLQLQYAGANRALYIFRNNQNNFEFVDIKPNKFPIGGYQLEATRSFNSTNIQLKKDDTFYIFSDGYADQFGGSSNKKFMVKRLQTELMNMQALPMNQQKDLVKKLVMDWKGDAEQVDDILMIGVRV